MNIQELTALLAREDMSFEEALQYFGDRVPVTPEVFYQIAEEYRHLAFTVTGYTSAEILKQFYEELLAALEDGTTLRDFKEHMNQFLEAKGYEGVDPTRADTIFRTNVQTAYNAGHYKELTDPEVLKMRPYWQYLAVEDAHTRPSHLAMNGRVYPADHPVWDTWYPPNGFNCRCTVRALSKRQVERQGLTVEERMPRDVVPDRNFSSNPAKSYWEPDSSELPAAIRKAYEGRKEKE